MLTSTASASAPTATPFGQSFNARNIFMQVAHAGLICVCLAALFSVLHPDVRTRARALLLKDFRTIVSTANADLIGDGSRFTVVKVKSRDSLSLEIYSSTITDIDMDKEGQGEGANRLIGRIEMPDKRDGYFNFNGQATNLAIDDINGDGRPEIIAPSFDQNLVGHLNVFQYNPDAKSFEHVTR